MTTPRRLRPQPSRPVVLLRFNTNITRDEAHAIKRRVKSATGLRCLVVGKPVAQVSILNTGVNAPTPQWAMTREEFEESVGRAVLKAANDAAGPPPPLPDVRLDYIYPKGGSL